MFLGILIGLTLWGLIARHSNPAVHMQPETRAALEAIHPHVLSSIRLKSITRLIALFAVLVGFCGAVGWCIEVILQ